MIARLIGAETLVLRNTSDGEIIAVIQPKTTEADITSQLEQAIMEHYSASAVSLSSVVTIIELPYKERYGLDAEIFNDDTSDMDSFELIVTTRY